MSHAGIDALNLPDRGQCPTAGWASVTERGALWCKNFRRLSYVLALQNARPVCWNWCIKGTGSEPVARPGLEPVLRLGPLPVGLTSLNSCMCQSDRSEHEDMDRSSV